MAPKAKKVQWQNAVQNHQNGEPLPVLDLKVEGYEQLKLYRWKMMCVISFVKSIRKITHNGHRWQAHPAQDVPEKSAKDQEAP
eukprot:1696022-Ditylum_brightwellii.AAC.1